ncbi:unnamed protein product [Parnassius mnemosyne]|uniref:Uncharacterized protein n=1 Tax=Parnassius mnemosyne TaxID=213953 RepID=A0AAV1LI63_9NEOP
MLLTGNIHCYADDSTGDALYTGRANISRENVAEYRNKLVSEVESLLDKVSDWGRINLVQFNPQKTQVCAFTAKKNSFVVSPQFQGTPLLASASIRRLNAAGIFEIALPRENIIFVFNYIFFYLV